MARGLFFCDLFSGGLLGGLLDTGQMVGPESFEGLDPVVHGFELLRVQPIQPRCPAL